MQNFNVPFVYGNIDLHNFKPHRKNPHIANVFSQTIMVEELGSGTKRIFKYTPLYAKGQMPEIYEDDYFTIVIPTPFLISDTNSDTNKGSNDTINGVSDTINGASDTKNVTINGGNDTINSSDVTINNGDVTINDVEVTINSADVTINGTYVTINQGPNISTPVEIIVNMIKSNPYVKGVELATHLGVSRRNIIRYLNKLQDEGRIIRVGAKKNGHWEVVEP